MRTLKLVKCILFFVPLFLVACEQPFVGEINPEDALGTPSAESNLILRVTAFEQIPFDNGVTKAAEDIPNVCSRLNFVVYDGDTKVQSVAQKKGDANFGTVALTLPKGKYRVAAIGHSSDGTATISSLDKISFKNNLVTDTFSECMEVEVGDEKQTLDMELKRVVAMFRLLLTEDLPSEIVQLKFYYTGGSSTLSALTGYGSVNSKQTVVMGVSEGQRQFDVYTIPHAETGELKMTISALDVNGTVMKERLFEAVPVERNVITRYSCDFFNGLLTETGESDFMIKVDAEWADEKDYKF